MLQPLSYRQVFVVHGPGFQDFAAVWIMLGAALFMWVLLLDGPSRRSFTAMSLRIARVLSGAFPVLAIITGIGTYNEFHRAEERYRRGDYQVVEGTVDDFKTSSRGAEEFRVGSQAFSYNTHSVSPYFHRTANEGGPIRWGLPVRISHQQGQILRIEVAVMRETGDTARLPGVRE